MEFEPLLLGRAVVVSVIDLSGPRLLLRDHLINEDDVTTFDLKRKILPGSFDHETMNQCYDFMR